MKNSFVTGVAGLAVIGTLAVLSYPPVDADASSPPSITDGAVTEQAARPLVVFPQSREPDPFYYKFGPYVFPPVLRVEPPPAVEMAQPAPPPAAPME